MVDLHFLETFLALKMFLFPTRLEGLLVVSQAACVKVNDTVVFGIRFGTDAQSQMIQQIQPL